MGVQVAYGVEGASANGSLASRMHPTKRIGQMKIINRLKLLHPYLGFIVNYDILSKLN